MHPYVHLNLVGSEIREKETETKVEMGVPLDDVALMSEQESFYTQQFVPVACDKRMGEISSLLLVLISPGIQPFPLNGVSLRKSSFHLAFQVASALP